MYECTASVVPSEHLVDLPTKDSVFQRIHGKDAKALSRAELGRESQWNVGYCNLEDAFIDAEAGVRVYYYRCLRSDSIRFKCGVAVDRINVVDSRSTGVVLEDGSEYSADLVIVAAGAWSNKLVSLGERMKAGLVQTYARRRGTMEEHVHHYKRQHGSQYIPTVPG